MRPDNLAATTLTGLPAEAPGLGHVAIGDVVWGDANGAGEDDATSTGWRRCRPDRR